MSKLTAVYLLVLSSAAFTLSTAFAKLAHQACAELSGFQVSFGRFIFGLLFMAVFVRVKKRSLRPNNITLVVWRGILNTSAVLTLYVSLRYTTVTNANLLNWSFPVFAFLVSPFINKERPGLVKYFFLALALAGTYFVVLPDFSSVNFGDAVALASGVLGGAAVCVLRESRKYDDSYLILFYLMLIGTVINGIAALPSMILPTPRVGSLIVASALSGFLGQILLTVGTRHFEAATGALIMEVGILFAAFLGIGFFGDPVTPALLFGGGLIVASVVGVSGVFDRRAGRK